MKTCLRYVGILLVLSFFLIIPSGGHPSLPFWAVIMTAGLEGSLRAFQVISWTVITMTLLVPLVRSQRPYAIVLSMIFLPSVVLECLDLIGDGSRAVSFPTIAFIFTSSGTPVMESRCHAFPIPRLAPPPFSATFAAEENAFVSFLFECFG